MKIFLISLFMLVLVSGWGTSAAQSITGNTTVTVDSTTNMVTATCETDVDEYSQGYYDPIVGCTLRDSNNNIVASDQYTDEEGDLSAVVVLQVQGVPGQTYTATGVHRAYPALQADNPDPGDENGNHNTQALIDFFDFQQASAYYQNQVLQWETAGGGLPSYYEWEGPGPETQVPEHAIILGNTTDSGSTQAPTIMFTGQSQATITNQTQSVMIGEQVALTVTYLPLPPDVYLKSQTWTVAGTTVGGYNPTGGGPTGTDFTQTNTTFYWEDTGTNTVTVTLSFSDNSSATAETTFTVGGPVGASLTASQLINPSVSNNQRLGPGNSVTVPGIVFSASPTNVTNGGYVFVQTINSYYVTHYDPMGQCVNSVGSGLDGQFPYTAFGSSTNDSPSAALFSSDSEVQASFSATMYVLWQSSTSGSIPVPLGYVSWQWSGDAVNGANDIWAISGVPSISATSFVPSLAYPTWAATITNPPAADSCRTGAYH